MLNKCYVILLNYNGWRDTIECLESVYKSSFESYQVIVVDNNSPNRSMDYIVNWAEGNQNVDYSQAGGLNVLGLPNEKKPIEYVLYDKEIAVAGGCKDAEKNFKNPLILIQTGENKGFSAGNNVGIQYVMAKGDAEFIWFLNNDTVIDPSALGKLVNKALAYNLIGRKVGIIGAKLMYYHQPSVIQSVGGVFNPWLATCKSLGAYEEDNGDFDTEAIESLIDFPVGASMFVSIGFIEDVGLMSEDYFLYFEELDWVLRGRVFSWNIGYCWEAKVYHKEGGSIGSSSVSTNRSLLSDYYGLRNRIVFTKKFYPNNIWFVRAGFVASAFNRLIRGQYDRFFLVLKTLIGRPLH